MKAERKITELEIQEISLVSQPACPQATIEITKSRRQNIVQKAAGVECRICGTRVKDEDKFCHECGAPFYKSEEPVKKEDKVEDPKVEKTEEATTEVEKTEVPAEQVEAPPVEPPDVPPAEAAPPPEPETPDPAEDLDKSAVDGVVVAKDAEIAELKKTLLEKERVIKKKEAADRITATMKSLPVKIEDLAELLVALAEKDADLAKSVEGIFAKASTLIDGGALEPATVESKGEGNSTVLDRVAKMAQDRAKEKGITLQKATAEIWHENPGLYSEYQKEKAA